MRARGDFLILSEPFAIYYYQGKDSSTKREYYSSAALPKRDVWNQASTSRPDWKDVLETILTTASSSPTFFKDMAYHLHNCQDFRFLAEFINAFIIRHPRYVLPSLLTLQPDSTFEETGYYDQHKIMTCCEHLTGQPPIIIDGQRLRKSPGETVSYFCERTGIEYIPNALNWEAKLQDEWDPYWVKEVAASTRFCNREHYDFEMLKQPAIKRLYKPCLELYEDMASRAIA